LYVDTISAGVDTPAYWLLALDELPVTFVASLPYAYGMST
jgi:hypothetical protein